jgi:hypothetical protein
VLRERLRGNNGLAAIDRCAGGGCWCGVAAGGRAR